jgi:hypothetical protein
VSKYADHQWGFVPWPAEEWARIVVSHVSARAASAALLFLELCVLATPIINEA